MTASSSLRAAERRAGYLAGGLTLASVFLALIRVDAIPVVVGALGPLALVAALLILALGLPGGGSIVARRPLGVAALVVLAVAVLLERVLVPWLLFNLIDMNLVASFWILTIVQVVAAVVAAREIAVAGVLTGAARFVPFVVIGALLVVGALALVLGRFPTELGVNGMLLAVQIPVILESAIVVTVGILLILAADRGRAPGRAEPTVVPSAYVAGALLVLAALLGAYIEVPLLVALLFAAAAIMLAIGTRGLPSITARVNPGTGALIALGVWAVIVAAISETAFGLDLAMAQPVLAHTIGPVIGGVLALVAAVQVRRAAVLSAPWRSVPLAVLAVLAAVFVIGEVRSTLGVMTSIYQFATLSIVLERAIMLALVVLGIGVLISGDRRSRTSTPPTVSGVPGIIGGTSARERHDDTPRRT